MKTQLKKGTLDMCVLAVLASGDSYAYELVSTLSKTMDISEGTIYPLMRRLQAEGVDVFSRVGIRPLAKILFADGARPGEPCRNADGVERVCQ